MINGIRAYTVGACRDEVLVPMVRAAFGISPGNEAFDYLMNNIFDVCGLPRDMNVFATTTCLASTSPAYNASGSDCEFALFVFVVALQNSFDVQVICCPR